eukprot:1147675-Pelagomonas_calceolata.AAC.10
MPTKVGCKITELTCQHVSSLAVRHFDHVNFASVIWSLLGQLQRNRHRPEPEQAETNALA